LRCTRDTKAPLLRIVDKPSRYQRTRAVSAWKIFCRFGISTRRSSVFRYIKRCTETVCVIWRSNIDMKRRAYWCDASRDLFEDYYSLQNGGEIPVFAGARFQRGHGLGSILGGFFRRLVLPFFKANGKQILANAVKTGMEVADDVLEGKSVKESTNWHKPAIRIPNSFSTRHRFHRVSTGRVKK